MVLAFIVMNVGLLFMNQLNIIKRNMSTEFEFTIEDNISYKQKKETVSKPTDKLNDAIYTYANKLNEGQSFFLENKLFLNIKWPNSKINSVLTKLRKFWKNSDMIVNYRIKTIKNENGDILGYRIFRINPEEA